MGKGVTIFLQRKLATRHVLFLLADGSLVLAPKAYLAMDTDRVA